MRYIYIIVGLVLTVAAQATVVRFDTVLGQFDVELFDQEAPLTVENFLNYVNDTDYDGTVVHRSAPGFVIQGGGFTFNTEQRVFDPIPVDPPVVNEFGISNTRGTIAMAKVAGNPDSATSQWFINLANNAANLDNQNGGFTVFGEVLGDGMQVVDAIAALPITVEGIPVIDFTGGDISLENFVVVNSVTVLPDPISINAGLSGAWFNPDSSSQGLFFEVLPDSNQVFMGWFTYDTALPDVDAVATVGAAGQRWLSGQGPITGNSVEMDVVLTSNGIFNSPQETDRTEPGAYGTVTVVFHDCANATVDYTLSAAGLSGSFDIVRIATDNVTLCEQLQPVETR